MEKIKKWFNRKRTAEMSDEEIKKNIKDINGMFYFMAIGILVLLVIGFALGFVIDRAPVATAGIFSLLILWLLLVAIQKSDLEIELRFRKLESTFSSQKTTEEKE